MKVAILSDQHGELPEIPPCDLVVLSGDITGGPAYVNDRWRPDLSDGHWRDWLRGPFSDWASKAGHVIMIGGNHDTAIERYGPPTLSNLEYLCDSQSVFGGWNFWGMPWIPTFDRLAFNLDKEPFVEKCSLIPPNINFLVCHAPPFGILDRTNSGFLAGSMATLEAIDRIQPKIVTCGHIHEARGLRQRGRTTIINSARSWTVIEI